ncbi:MAG: hypothetical protein ACPGYT_04030 [Nitrospirales bacterium]
MSVFECKSSKTLSSVSGCHSQSTIRKAKLRCLSGVMVAAFCMFGTTMVFADQGEGPQELPKPKFKTTPPLFMDWNFDKDQIGEQPGGFNQGVNGQAGGQWLVTKEEAAPSKTQVIEQKGTCAEASCYQILLGEGTDVSYVDVSVRMKLVLGTASGKAGIVLGAQDDKNFYAAVVTPKTNTIEAYVVRDGKITSFGEAKIKPKSEEWHYLRVQRSPMISHDLFNVFFDRHMLLSLSDSTFKEGKVGLVTWGDGAFAFDNLRAVEYLTNLPLSRPPAY